MYVWHTCRSTAENERATASLCANSEPVTALQVNEQLLSTIATRRNIRFHLFWSLPLEASVPHPADLAKCVKQKYPSPGSFCYASQLYLACMTSSWCTCNIVLDHCSSISPIPHSERLHICNSWPTFSCNSLQRRPNSTRYNVCSVIGFGAHLCSHLDDDTLS